jgi:hypothetical protein
VVAELTGQPRVRQPGEEGGRAVEVGHLQVGRADPGRVVRVRARAAGDAESPCQVFGLLVERVVGDLGVEHLDDVDVAVRAEVGEHRAEAGPPLVERVRHVDQALLRLDPADDLGQRQHVGDPLGQEQPDHVAVRRPDLLADDDTDAEVALGRPGRGLGHIVIGDADDVEAGRLGALGQLRQRQHRVAGRDRVQVAVDPHPPGRGHDPHPTPPSLRPRPPGIDTAAAVVRIFSRASSLENISRKPF